MNKRVALVRVEYTLTLTLLFTFAAIDIAVPLGVAAGVPFVIPVMMAYRSSKKSFIVGIVAAACLLTLLGMFLSPGGGDLEKVVANRALAIVVILGTGAFTFVLLGIQEKIRTRVAALDAAADMVLITDVHGNIEYVNKSFVEQTGYEPEEVIGNNPRFLKSNRQGIDFYQNLWGTITSGQTWEGRLINQKKDGSEYTEQMSITPVLDKSGKPNRFIAVKRDVTDTVNEEIERETTRKLEAENTELVRVNEVRREFLSTVSHELRTPLASLLAFGDILSKNKGGTMTPVQLEQVNYMRKSGWRLDELINDLLDVSRAEAGTFKLQLQHIELTSLVNEVICSTLPILERKSQQLTTCIKPKTLWMLGDPVRLVQVISNLLINASKYSLVDSEIEVQISDSDGEIEITVADKGIGISESDISQVFTPFFRVNNEQTRKEGGTGLGLVVAKTIVELHDGQLSIESELGVGTIARISLSAITLDSETASKSYARAIHE